MEKESLVDKLNWFYSLEINQVDLYKTQSRVAENPHLKLALEKFAYIEQGHVENIRELIEELGETPTIIGEVIAEITGILAGKLTSLTSWDKTLRFNVAIEKKAIADYRELIKMVDSPDIKDLLLNNLIDEELHINWLEHQALEYIQ